ncbi:MAG: hypothetical protein R3F61_31600 [Myxococcota bacterium]
MPSLELPGRHPDEEDAFVSEWMDSDDTDALVEMVSLAVEARRPHLAGRLFQLLDEQIDPEPGSPLDRAARAARMFLLAKTRPEDHSWSELDDAWAAARRARVRRIKQRWRDRIDGRTDRISRLDRRRR